jgi:hypothetical protein
MLGFMLMGLFSSLFVLSLLRELACHVEPLRQLSSTHGTFFVTGNHGYYSGVDAWVTNFGAHHFDESHRSDPHRALADAPLQAVFRLLLAHQPRSAPMAAAAGFDLQLSRHTHGGQFWPWNHFVRLQQPFTAGLHHLQSLWVHTSRGPGLSRAAYRTRCAPGTPSCGCRRPATAQAPSSASPAAANTPATGENCSTTHATPGPTMPDTSRNVEYTADISVRWDGLTAIMNGRPPQISSSTRK